MMDKDGWTTFLQDWSSRALTLLRGGLQTGDGGHEEFIRTETSLRTPAPAAAILACEERLGARLPAGYRSFLSASNGALLIVGYGSVRLLSVGEIDWLLEKSPNVCRAWGMDIGVSVPDSQYFRYGDDQDPVQYRREYVSEALQISDGAEGDHYVLNPLVVANDGEWEAWELNKDFPGAERQPSFEALLRSRRKQMEEAAKLKR